ncbi:MAG: hypothetical protein NZ700_15905 [Gemmataceae bacterium]|nr:hypothetical protein [Gemmataceae bacterium]MDW8266552.1 hypothetical protein [Gemmataceae bacterium]
MNRLTITLTMLLGAGAVGQTSIPPEPVEIGTTPQLVLDSYIVDNTWAVRYKTQHVNRVFHPPRKHPGNPLLRGPVNYVCAARDEPSGKFHLWYQTSVRGQDEERAQYAIAYASSTDGIRWEQPNLGLHEWQGSRDNNVVVCGRRRASGPWLVQVPPADRRDYRFLLAYRDADGIHLIASRDGVHFDPASDRRIVPLPSDTQNAIVWDPHRNEYALFGRAKTIYRATGDGILDTGESRRIARLENKELWADWSPDARHILLPDELDTRERYHAFYGMPTTVYAGIFFGFLWPFRWNDRIHTELAWSRDGIQFERHPLRPRLIDYGPAGSWDDEMVLASQWVEVGDEWWIYYAGWDGPHQSPERHGGIGLATLRKEGFVSLRGPAGGGVVCTRVLRWPGGKLWVNADAARGRLTVRVSTPHRAVVPGFDHADCLPFQGDRVAAEIRWKQRSIAELKGQEIRLEFFLQDADLYSFRAGP